MKINAKVQISYNGKTPKQMQADWNRFIQKELPVIIGREAVNFFKDRFRFGGWIDTGFEKWKPRNPNAPRNNGRALLIDTGRLRNSIRVIEQGANYVVIGTDVPYAEAHNEGTNETVTVSPHRRKNKFGDKFTAKKGKELKKSTKIKWEVKASGVTFVQSHQRKMNIPERRFMGASEFLFKRINRVVEQRAKEIFG